VTDDINLLGLFLDQELIPMSLVFFVLFLLGQCSSKKPEDIVSNRIMVKFSRIVLQVIAHQFTESDFSYNVILSIWWP